MYGLKKHRLNSENGKRGLHLLFEVVLSLLMALGIGLLMSPITAFAADPPDIYPSSTLPDGTVGQAYSQQFSLNPDESISGTWSLFGGIGGGTPPTFLQIDSSTGLLSGTPTQAGTYHFAVKFIRNEGNWVNPVDHSSINNVTAPALTLVINSVGGGEEPHTGSGSSTGATGMATGSTSGAASSTGKSGGAAATAKPMDPAEAAKLYEFLRSQGISFGTPSAPACNHSYEWVETKQATENDNGECAYKCKLCGDVLYRIPTNAMGVFVQNTINNIVKAPQGGTVVIDTDRWYSFPKSVFDALAARPDLTLTVNYLSEGFKGDPMTFTIPAGTDVSKLPDEKGYAGFTFLGGIFGATPR